MNYGYGVYVNNMGAIVNIYGGDFVATTHVVYVEKGGTVNIYGGSFRLTGDYTPDTRFEDGLPSQSREKMLGGVQP